MLNAFIAHIARLDSEWGTRCHKRDNVIIYKNLIQRKDEAAQNSKKNVSLKPVITWIDKILCHIYYSYTKTDDSLDK